MRVHSRWIHSFEIFPLRPIRNFISEQCNARNDVVGKGSDYSPLGATITLCYSVCTRADRDYVVFSFICWFILEKTGGGCSSRSRNERWSLRMLRSRRNRGKERNSHRIASFRLDACFLGKEGIEKLVGRYSEKAWYSKNIETYASKFNFPLDKARRLALVSFYLMRN